LAEESCLTAVLLSEAMITGLKGLVIGVPPQNTAKKRTGEGK